MNPRLREENIPRSLLPFIGKLRGLGQRPNPQLSWGLRSDKKEGDAKKQLFHRLPSEVINRTLEHFNDGSLSWQDAAARLGISKSQLYDLRTRWLKNAKNLLPRISGGNHKAPWPDEVTGFMQRLLATGEKPNFSFIRDELERRFGFTRSISNIRNHALAHMAGLLSKPLSRGPKPRRRWQRKGYGDLLQHDSSPHQWWPGERLQILALTIDDATRSIVGARFIEAETTFAHLAHVRKIFLTHGLPNDLYTDGLSLFGHESRKAGDSDTLSQFQRALGCLGVSHLVARDPQSKGKVERQFNLWQKRLPALFRLEGITNHDDANSLLAEQIHWYEHKHVCRSTGMTPRQAIEKNLEEGHACWRPAPPECLLDLHLSVHHQRVVSAAHQISFLGRQWDITPCANKRVCVVQQPDRFWVIAKKPTPQTPQWPDILAEYRL